jgi:4-methylaminobutanoate oxidase (formaldehyde-forming)
MLLERRRLAQLISSQAAGLLTTARSETAVTQLIMETYRTIVTLEDQLGEELNLKQNGSLHSAVSPENSNAFQNQAVLLTKVNIRHEWIWPAAVKAAVPWLYLPDEAAVLFLPHNGFIDPYLLTRAYARAARLNGVVANEETAVTGIQRQGDRVTAVETTQGNISAPMIIVTNGVWASLLTWQIGCSLPMAPVRSEY